MKITAGFFLHLAQIVGRIINSYLSCRSAALLFRIPDPGREAER